jgi:hypothetical protein
MNHRKKEKNELVGCGGGEGGRGWKSQGLTVVIFPIEDRANSSPFTIMQINTLYLVRAHTGDMVRSVPKDFVKHIPVRFYLSLAN